MIFAQIGQILSFSKDRKRIKSSEKWEDYKRIDYSIRKNRNIENLTIVECNFLRHDIIHNKQSHKILTSSDTIFQTASQIIIT